MEKKLGRKPRSFDPRIPHYSALRFMKDAQLPALPLEINNAPGVTDFGMMGNDTLGDCTCAAIYHARQIWTQDAQGKEDTQPDSVVIKLYEDACGYNPADPSTDQGGNEQDVLSYLLNTGYPVEGREPDKIVAYVEVNPLQLNDIRRTIMECGVCYIGVNLPNSAIDAKVWDIGGDDSIAGGHAVILYGYDAAKKLWNLVSWGEALQCTDAFIKKFCVEAYAIASADYIEATGKTPLGLTVPQLESVMTAIKE